MNARRKVVAFFGFGLLALLLIGLAGAVWAALAYANLKTTPSIPWCLPAIAAALWLMWRYLGGRGRPRSTSASRRRLLRANPVTRQALTWSLIAGILAIVALAGYWIVLFSLVRLPPNPLVPQNFVSSPVMIAAFILGASLVAPIAEESAVRGYLQSSLEREFRPATAVLLSSVVFALAHVTQGVMWPKLFLYLLVGVTFGTMAYLNDSILPVIPVHFLADVTFFVLIWPHDAGRTLVSQSGAGLWFWVHVAQAVGFTCLAIVAFRRLARVTAEHRRELAHSAVSRG